LVFTRNQSSSNGGQEIFVLDLRSGRAAQITNNGVSDWIPHWSPDGKTIIYTSFRNGNYDIWRMDANGGNAKPVISLPAWDDYAAWSPDGSRIAFISTGDTEGVTNSELFVRLSNGEIQRLTHNKGRDEWPSWSPNGKRVAVSSDRHGNMNIYSIASTGGDPIRLTNWAGFEEQPAWSPDGKWIAFIGKTRDTNGNGRLERVDDGDLGSLWIGRRDGSDFRQLTFEDRFADPAWSPDGQFLVVAAFHDSSGDGHLSSRDNSHLWAVPLGGGEPVSLTDGAVQDRYPDWTR
jgi:TolB protein